MPKRLIVEYEDSSRKETDFGKLSRPSWLELSKLGLCPPPSYAPPLSKNYLLLQWQDGWQEVLGVDESPFELLRYYVLERIEEAGRIALQAGGDYPTLMVIRRKPKELESLAIVGSGSMKTYVLDHESANKEGDKIEQHYRVTESKRNSLNEIKGLLKKALEAGGIEAQELLDNNHAQLAEYCETLRKRIGLRSSEKQEDVLSFVEIMLQILAKEEGKQQ